MGGFHVHLLVYPFIYHFFTRKSALVESTFSNPAELFIFISFHIHFKIFWYSGLLKTRGIFCPQFILLQRNDIWTDKQTIIWVAIWANVLVNNWTSSKLKPYFSGQWSFLRGLVRSFFWISWQWLVLYTIVLVADNWYKRSLVQSSTDQKDRALLDQNVN